MRITYFTILIFGVSAAVSYAANVPQTIAVFESETGPVEDDVFILPEGIKSCRRNDPELNQCIKNSINEQLPLLHKGSKVLNIPPLDPFSIPDGRYGYSSGPVGGTLVLKGVNIFGMSKASLKKVDTKLNEHSLTSTMLLYCPRIIVDGNYKADVKINELKMRPKGYFNLTITDMSVKIKTYGNFEILNGKKHLQMKSVEIDPEIGDLKIFATGIFPDPLINNAVLEFANQYWPEIIKTVVPQTRSTWEPLILEPSNKFFGTVPIDVLLTSDSK